ncbi:EscN/YscN/HrcN family type III secretion system ATPase, partial [Xanthomonas perforans]|nr:EscN/YscN/HrcN family type III secretion system ATPase [Xanthomonas perforans]
RRGFPPSVFAELPRLLERAGMGESGSITAFYTVLAEDDTGSDPIAEEVRGILDGHLILSREIAAKNQYPAIDVLASLSRVMSQIVPYDHSQAAGRLRRLLAKYNEVETLVQVGEYRQGSDAVADEAIDRIDAIRDFLSQPTDQLSAYENTLELLTSVTDDA